MRQDGFTENKIRIEAPQIYSIGTYTSEVVITLYLTAVRREAKLHGDDQVADINQYWLPND